MPVGLAAPNAAWKEDPVEKMLTETLRRQMRGNAATPIGRGGASAALRGAGDGFGECEAGNPVASLVEMLQARRDVDCITLGRANGAAADRDADGDDAQRIEFRMSSSTLLVRVSMDVSASSGAIGAWRVDPVVDVDALPRHVAHVDAAVLDALVAHAA